MSENDSGGSGLNLGCLSTIVAASTFVATFALGPMDFGRSVYNQIVGDTPVLKRQLVDYSRKDIAKAHPNYAPNDVEKALAGELGYSLPTGENAQIDPLDVSIHKLWDASEDHASSMYQRWVWPSLD